MNKKNSFHYFLTGCFLFPIFGVSVAQAFIEIGRGERPYFLTVFTQPPTKSHLREFDKGIEKASWFSQQIQPVMRSIQYLLLGETGDKAIEGRNRWFYFKQDARYLIEPWPVERETFDADDDPVQAIVSFRDQLKTRGIELWVMPTPGKPSVYPQQLTSRAANHDPSIHAHSHKVMNRLREAGIQTIDLFALFGREVQKAEENLGFLYLSQDTHWATRGMSIAARETAHSLLGSGIVTKGEGLYAKNEVHLQRHGDVIKMMDIPYLTRTLPKESLVCEQVVSATDETPFASDPNAPILVMGDSFLRIFELDEPKSAGFISHLAYALQQPVTALITDGGASTIVRQELARRPQLLANKKVVVWEFVERDIRFGAEGWKEVKLPMR